MDFYKIKERSVKNGVIEIYPDFKVCRSKDLMVRGKSFYAIWDEEKNLWSTDEYDVQRLVDNDLIAHAKKVKVKTDGAIRVLTLEDYSSKSWSEFKSYLNNLSDNAVQLDTEPVFSNTQITKKSYASKVLPYPLEEGPHDAYDKLISTLYDEEEKTKLEWSIGAIISGDSKKIQKFIVLYGSAGAGKSTILNIIQKLFEGYYTAFDAKALTSSNQAFATESFKSNPLVAIQHDGDLSKIEDNTKLNSIVSHEKMTINEKYKASYMERIQSFLYMGTNTPVKITNAKSGIIRRLIDVTPSGNRVGIKEYHELMSKIDFELGAIAYHCLTLYNKLGMDYYDTYKPYGMMFQTDVFFNFVEAHYEIFVEEDGISLSRAYSLYKEYCDESQLRTMPKYKFREELKNYFEDFKIHSKVNGISQRNYYAGFKFQSYVVKADEENTPSLVIDQSVSILDDLCKDNKAQYAVSSGIPADKWDKVATTLKDLDTSKLHYVMLNDNHIVIDFDLTDENGDKSLEKNLEAASKFPETYAELSKSGKGIHLHYIYDGDITKLTRIYDTNIEIKVPTGHSSLRRKFTLGNDVPIKTIRSGLPLKGANQMINFEAVKSEKLLREMIKKNLRKEVHGSTKPSIDFIVKILDDAYKSGLNYDITDMRPAILAFANNSTNQASYCVEAVCDMKFKSEEASEQKTDYEEDALVFYDVEVFPNLFVVCWKKEGSDVVTMINPSPEEIEALLSYKLVGFNNRRYDNHIIYARYLGYNNDQLYKLSQRIINNSENCMFAEAYGLSYTDIYCFSSKKQSLKKFEIELGIHHHELGLPWDQPVPEDMWLEVAKYCANDVIATEETFKARYEDFKARQILADLSGLTVNDSTQKHVAKIIFGNDKDHKSKFVYTDLSEMFPGYKYEYGKSTYRGEEIGEGGYVYSEPGMYVNAALIDVASMHPTSGIALNIFGPYTKRFKEIIDARLAIKHKEFDKAGKMLNGILKPYLGETDKSDDLAYALKIVINIIYGLTSAKFDNAFTDPRNIDNIVAKRGALFMVDLKHAVQEQGYTVAHIKTDSIKIPNADEKIIAFVMEFGEKYGYTFEHEATYDKMCLVNNAVYIAKYDGKWSATGAQFAHPFVFKTLFSKEPILFEDMCETKAVKTALYLDMNEGLPEGEHNYKFVGKVGSFCPIQEGCGGGVLLREKEGQYHAATGTKGYRWLEAEVVVKLKKEEDVDISYHTKLVDDAISNIEQYGDSEWFRGDDDTIPNTPCFSLKYNDCFECPKSEYGFKEKCELGYDVVPF